MIRRILVSVGLAAASLIAIPVVESAPASAAPPAAIQQCMNGGWRTLTDASGQPFRNQGQCISYEIHHPVSLADLASPSTFEGAMDDAGQGCAFIFQGFFGSYSGGGPVGTVNLSILGCVIPSSPTLTYTGSFTITTDIGTLSGSASGPISVNVDLFPNYLLTLTVVTGTGSFAGMMGNLQASLFPNASLDQPLPTSFVGSITVP